MPDSMLEPEFESAFTAWKASPGPQTNSALLKAVSPVIDTALTTYAGKGHSPTLRSHARSMALSAFKTYDPTRGRLRSHMLSSMQRLRRISAQEQQIISIPEAVSLDYQHLMEAEKDLADVNGRMPSDLELADRTGLSLKRIAHIRQSQLPVAEGTTQLGVDGEGPQDVGVTIPGRQNKAWENFVYLDLGNTDRFIMDAALGRNGRRPMSVSQIAQALRITPSAVSQRAQKIQKLLDRPNRLGL